MLLHRCEQPHRAGRSGDGDRDGDPGDGPPRVVAAHDQHRLVHAPRQACACVRHRALSRMRGWAQPVEGCGLPSSM